jgi:hypothetical protein
MEEQPVHFTARNERKVEKNRRVPKSHLNTLPPMTKTSHYASSSEDSTTSQERHGLEANSLTVGLL